MLNINLQPAARENNAVFIRSGASTLVYRNGVLAETVASGAATFIIPQGVSRMYWTATAPGGGGGGGHATAGGGGGGGGGQCFVNMPVIVVPGESISIAVGLGGTAGAIGGNGGAGGPTIITSSAGILWAPSNQYLQLFPGNGGSAGASPNGGSGGGGSFGNT